MKKFKGTKGVWKVQSNKTKYETSIYCGKKRIAEVKHYNTGLNDWTKNDPKYSEGIANAKLISVAPKMLAALIEISKGKGRYNEDKLIHASNTIEDMIKLAQETISEAV